MQLKLPTYVFINGPPGSGKSTLASLLANSTNGCWRESFAEPIRDMIRTVFFPHEGPISYSHDLKTGSIKKQNMLALAGLNAPDTFVGPTVRDTMIDFSQTFMKRHFGDDIFGRLLWRRCQEQIFWYNHFIIDDSGFVPESSYVISQAGPDSCLLIRLHRAGTDFSQDSRGYLDLPIRSIDLHNDSAALEMIAELELSLGHI